MGSATSTMSKRRHQTGVCEHPHGPYFREIEHHGTIVVAFDEEGDHAISTGIGAAHDARVAVDDEFVVTIVSAVAVVTGACGCQRV